MQTFTPSAIITPEALENLEHYEMFLRTLLGFLDRRKDANRKINIFITNYDGCLAHAADRLLVKGVHEFVVNDGTSGFYKKHLHAKNFNTFQCQAGVFERAAYGVP
ncbi:hypothetical protein V2J95_21290 [Pseudomonas alliivorans]|nr:hypothetical protein [Pseudomonas alliivorans]